jgi:flagellar motor switch protein FliN
MLPDENGESSVGALAGGSPKAPVDQVARGDTGPLVPIGSRLLEGVQIVLDARLGETSMRIEELYALRVGSVVALDMPLGQPVTLLLNDQPVARGDIVAVDGHFGIRITEIGPIEHK